jgi:hypothetical protein
MAKISPTFIQDSGLLARAGFMDKNAPKGKPTKIMVKNQSHSP